VWAASRLARVQIALWGHPSTSGMTSIDYFLSSDSFHEEVNAFGDPQNQFIEQLVRLDSLGFYFERPLLLAWKSKIELLGLPDKFYEDSLVERPALLFDHLFETASKAHWQHKLVDLLKLKQSSNSTFILCPQHLPKFHPSVIFSFFIFSLL
jgi:hypothetical protein